MDANGHPIYEIDKIEPIGTFQKGMYVDYRPKKDKNGQIARATDGRPIDDKTQPRGYYRFVKQLN